MPSAGWLNHWVKGLSLGSSTWTGWPLASTCAFAPTTFVTSAAIIFWALTLLAACTDASWLADSLTLLTEFPAGSVPLSVFSFGAITLYWPVWVVSCMHICPT